MGTTQLIECDRCTKTVKEKRLSEGWSEVNIEIVEPRAVRQDIDEDSDETEDQYSKELIFCPSCTQDLLRKVTR